MIEKIIYNDNLIVAKKINDNSIDLIYSDILYGTGKNFGAFKDIQAIKKEIEEFYTPRLIEFHRILKVTGNIVLQMDKRINHWIRIILDNIFEYNNFRKGAMRLMKALCGRKNP